MGKWNHNIQYHDILLRAVPPRCQHALDVGCGTGSFARQHALSSREAQGPPDAAPKNGGTYPSSRDSAAMTCASSSEVIAIDADRDTLERGRMATAAETRVAFVEGDVMTHPFCDNSFNFIAAVATLHHLPLGRALTRFRNLLKSGGVLGVIGLYRPRTAKDFALAAAALPTSWTMRRLRDYTDVEALCGSQKRRCAKYGPHAMPHCSAAQFAGIAFPILAHLA